MLMPREADTDLPRLKVIVIEGNIGVGKSTTGEALAALCKQQTTRQARDGNDATVIFMKEPVELWKRNGWRIWRLKR